MQTAFKIQRIVWHEVQDNIDVDPIHEALNTYIDLASYGSGLQSLSFTFVAVEPDNTRHGNDARYIKKSKHLEVRLGLSYEHVKTASPQRCLEMMAALFLVSIDLYKRFNIQDFDLNAFKKDVAHLFDTKGWLKVVQNR